MEEPEVELVALHTPVGDHHDLDDDQEGGDDVAVRVLQRGEDDEGGCVLGAKADEHGRDPLSSHSLLLPPLHNHNDNDNGVGDDGDDNRDDNRDDERENGQAEPGADLAQVMAGKREGDKGKEEDNDYRLSAAERDLKELMNDVSHALPQPMKGREGGNAGFSKPRDVDFAARAVTLELRLAVHRMVLTKGLVLAVVYVKRGDEGGWESVGRLTSRRFADNTVLFNSTVSVQYDPSNKDDQSVGVVFVDVGLVKDQQGDHCPSSFHARDVVGYHCASMRAVYLASAAAPRGHVYTAPVRGTRAVGSVGHVSLSLGEIHAPPFTASLVLGVATPTHGGHVKAPQSLFLVVSRVIEGIGAMPVYRSPLPTHQGHWKEFSLSLRKLCNGDFEAPILFQVCTLAASGGLTTLGWATSSLLELERSQGDVVGLCKPIGDANTDGNRDDDAPPLMCLAVHRVEIKSWQQSNAGRKLGLSLPLRTLKREKSRRLHTSQASLTLKKNVYQRIRERKMTRWQRARLWVVGRPVVHALLSVRPLHALARAIEAKHGSTARSLFWLSDHLLMLNTLLAVLWLAFVLQRQWDEVPHDNDVVVPAMFGFATYATRANWVVYSHFPSRLGSYDMDAAYVSVAVVGALVSAVYIGALLYSTTKQRFNAKSATVLSQDAHAARLATLVFGGWDHSSQSSWSVRRHTQEIATALREGLSVIRVPRSPHALRRKIVGICVVVVFVGASVWGVQYVVERHYDINGDQARVWVTGLVVAAVTVALPWLNRLVLELEGTENKKERYYHQLVRTYVGRVVVLACVYVTAINHEHTHGECTQDLVGRLFLQLVVWESILTIAIAYGMPLFRWLVLAECFRNSRPMLWRKRATYTIDVPTAMIGEIGRYATAWIGSSFCPILPAVASVCGLCVFVAVAHTTLVFSSPPKTLVKVSRVNVVRLLWLTLVLTWGPLTWFLSQDFSKNQGQDNTVERQCGPHSHGNYVYSYLYKHWHADGSVLSYVLQWALHPLVLLPVIAFVLLQARFSAKRGAVLRGMLRQALQDMEEERADKLRLLDAAGVKIL